jgi:D-alanyl-D-alanine carboxypeptidase (penicillin-binding protein 5/6)
LPDPSTTRRRATWQLWRARLIRDFPEEYAKYYSMKEFRYNNITQPNRNRLLWIDPTVDGLKTGHTEAAGYCLVSSAKRGPRRLLSVVLGAASDSAPGVAEAAQLRLPVLRRRAVVCQERAGFHAEVWKGKESHGQDGLCQRSRDRRAQGFRPKIKTELGFATAFDGAGERRGRCWRR